MMTNTKKQTYRETSTILQVHFIHRIGSNFDISIKNKHRTYPDPLGPLKLSILLLNSSIVEF